MFILLTVIILNYFTYIFKQCIYFKFIIFFFFFFLFFIIIIFNYIILFI